MTATPAHRVHPEAARRRVHPEATRRRVHPEAARSQRTRPGPERRVSVGERINVNLPAGRLQQELEARGIRLTRQRRVILQVMETAQRHLDAATILRRAQSASGGRVHRVTVYRTLDLLKRHGLIDELDLLHLRGDGHYYESHGPRDHIHIACLRCGKVREFESRLFERLKRQIERDCGIKITVARTEIGGYCHSCRQ